MAFRRKLPRQQKATAFAVDECASVWPDVASSLVPNRAVKNSICRPEREFRFFRNNSWRSETPANSIFEPERRVLVGMCPERGAIYMTLHLREAKSFHLQ